ncbi:E3 ubiquitin-protein ligase SIRP1-like [Quercus suber]|uniref:RING-type E3 ubiquitin transferase n=1 Tax=Quercus suber TaxID=58331 RepID=A0AAW0K1Q8_QUESU|nr:E3 ubiquitin-protein ligase SIRP1-like [Quercus suber]
MTTRWKSMPSVTVTAEESQDCSIYLEQFEVGSEAREMPCKHKFHSACIQNWLRVRRSCPLCRFAMPLEEEEEEEEEDGRGIHQHQPILICLILVVHLSPYRVQVFNSGSNRFRRVDSGLNLGSDVDSVMDMDID